MFKISPINVFSIIIYLSTFLYNKRESQVPLFSTTLTSFGEVMQIISNFYNLPFIPLPIGIEAQYIPLKKNNKKKQQKTNKNKQTNKKRRTNDKKGRRKKDKNACTSENKNYADKGFSPFTTGHEPIMFLLHLSAELYVWI